MTQSFASIQTGCWIDLEGVPAEDREIARRIKREIDEWRRDR